MSLDLCKVIPESRDGAVATTKTEIKDLYGIKYLILMVKNVTTILFQQISLTCSPLLCFLSNWVGFGARGGRGDSHIKAAGMLVGNFELKNLKGDQSGRGLHESSK